MPSWNDLLLEIKNQSKTVDEVRREQLDRFQRSRHRNLICYYSGWLNKPNLPREFISINDDDIHSFMCVLKGMDKKKGLDLFLHTPGGSVATTKKIIDYLRSLFKADIEVFVPQMAMSAGTMVACASKLIHMGKHSSLGPTDPHFYGIGAYSVKKAFDMTLKAMKKDPHLGQLWTNLLQKYHPSFVVDCDRVINWSRDIMREWIKNGEMFSEEDKDKKAKEIVDNFNNESIYEKVPHDVQFSPDECIEKGLKVNKLEDEGNDGLQENVLSIHHAYMLSFSLTNSYKIVENHNSIAKISSLANARR